MLIICETTRLVCVVIVSSLVGAKYMSFICVW